MSVILIATLFYKALNLQGEISWDIFCMSFVTGFISTYNKVYSWLGSGNLRYSGKFIINEYIKARRFMFSYIEDHRSAIQ